MGKERLALREQQISLNPVRQWAGSQLGVVVVLLTSSSSWQKFFPPAHHVPVTPSSPPSAQGFHHKGYFFGTFPVMPVLVARLGCWRQVSQVEGFPLASL